MRARAERVRLRAPAGVREVEYALEALVEALEQQPALHDGARVAAHELREGGGHRRVA